MFQMLSHIGSPYFGSHNFSQIVQFCFDLYISCLCFFRSEMFYVVTEKQSMCAVAGFEGYACLTLCVKIWG